VAAFDCVVGVYNYGINVAKLIDAPGYFLIFRVGGGQPLAGIVLRIYKLGQVSGLDVHADAPFRRSPK